ncbi:MAG: hypothetical protein AABZ55_10960, partial [Bdellovibrionota bacterium]
KSLPIPTWSRICIFGLGNLTVWYFFFGYSFNDKSVFVYYWSNLFVFYLGSIGLVYRDRKTLNLAQIFTTIVVFALPLVYFFLFNRIKLALRPLASIELSFFFVFQSLIWIAILVWVRRFFLQLLAWLTFVTAWCFIGLFIYQPKDWGGLGFIVFAAASGWIGSGCFAIATVVKNNRYPRKKKYLVILVLIAVTISPFSYFYMTVVRPKQLKQQETSHFRSSIISLDSLDVESGLRKCRDEFSQPNRAQLLKSCNNHVFTNSINHSNSMSDCQKRFQESLSIDSDYSSIELENALLECAKKHDLLNLEPNFKVTFCNGLKSFREECWSVSGLISTLSSLSQCDEIFSRPDLKGYCAGLILGKTLIAGKADNSNAAKRACFQFIQLRKTIKNLNTVGDPFYNCIQGIAKTSKDPSVCDNFKYSWDIEKCKNELK